ncbi:hypothetical protein ABEW34_21645 [Paenibacillus algorifonticola]|uniref:hypothetical protein n=1 Tax=Paenibacillus algorifonticola TaxID=684063 RepID=UPI003D286DB3
MKWILILILMTPVILSFNVQSSDEALKIKLSTQLKETMDVATHDAAIQVDQEELEQGRVSFTEAAERVFRESIERSNRLNPEWQPMGNSTWKDPIELVLFDRVESGSFPRLYNSGPPYYYMDVLQGPSVVAVVKVKHPRYYGLSDDFEYIVGSSHEYVE